MSLKGLFGMWKDMVSLGLGEIQVGLEMIREAKKGKSQ